MAGMKKPNHHAEPTKSRPLKKIKTKITYALYVYLAIYGSSADMAIENVFVLIYKQPAFRYQVYKPCTLVITDRTNSLYEINR